MRQVIVDLKAEHPAFRPHEIATICYLRFGRKPSHQSVQKVLADGPKPTISRRRFPPYGQIADGDQRRRIVVELHAEGWSISSISTYMQTSRHTIYNILKRWATEGQAGLDDKPPIPREPARKVSFQDIQEVRRLARHPDLGAYRVMAALEQIGIKLSQRTCGRLLQLNRKLYGLEKAKRSPGTKKEMPFKASFRHQWWSVDVRYIEKHQIPDHHGPAYLISILENYSRCVLASKISPTQNQWDYLEVLFNALSTAGVPKGIVSDGGAIFHCYQALQVYQALNIQKEHIDKGQSWENYIETMFNIVRRMADAKFAQATSWEEMARTHRRWMSDYNSQRHWAHEKREDGCHSPAEVMGWHKGIMYPQEVLNHILFATRYTRRLDQYGYLRFQHWKLYGNQALAQKAVTIWVYDGSLKVEYQAVTLSKYQVELQEDRRQVKAVSHPRLAETPFRSPQLALFTLGPEEWLLYWHAPPYAPSRRQRPIAGITQPPLFDQAELEQAAGAEMSQPFLRFVPRSEETEP
jgi:transposase